MTLFVLPALDLELEISDDNMDDAALHFRIVGPESKLAMIRGSVGAEQQLEGMMSPKAAITLPDEVKAGAGIPPQAVQFAFVYPIDGMHESVKQLEKIVSDEDAWIYMLMLGGFVYFDDGGACCSVNALTLSLSKISLKLRGPYSATASAHDEIVRQGRMQEVTLDVLLSAGLLSFAWAHPSEQPGGHSLGATPWPDGAFLYDVRDKALADPRQVYYVISAEPVPSVGAGRRGRKVAPARSPTAALGAFVDSLRDAYDHELMTRAEEEELLTKLHRFNSRKEGKQGRAWLRKAAVDVGEFTLILSVPCGMYAALYYTARSLSVLFLLYYGLWVLVARWAFIDISRASGLRLRWSRYGRPLLSTLVAVPLVGYVSVLILTYTLDAGVSLNVAITTASMLLYTTIAIGVPLLLRQQRELCAAMLAMMGDKTAAILSTVSIVGLERQRSSLVTVIAPAPAHTRIGAPSTLKGSAPEPPATSPGGKVDRRVQEAALVHLQAAVRKRLARRRYTALAAERRMRLLEFSRPIYFATMGYLACDFAGQYLASLEVIHPGAKIFFWLPALLCCVVVLYRDQWGESPPRFSVTHLCFLIFVLYPLTLKIIEFDVILLEEFSRLPFLGTLDISLVSLVHEALVVVLYTAASEALSMAAAPNTRAHYMLPFVLFQALVPLVFFNLNSIANSTLASWVVYLATSQFFVQLAKQSGITAALIKGGTKYLLSGVKRHFQQAHKLPRTSIGINPQDDPVFQLQFLTRIILYWQMCYPLALTFTGAFVVTQMSLSGNFAFGNRVLLRGWCDFMTFVWRHAVAFCLAMVVSISAQNYLDRQLRKLLTGKRTIFGSSPLVAAAIARHRAGATASSDELVDPSIAYRELTEDEQRDVRSELSISNLRIEALQAEMRRNFVERTAVLWFQMLGIIWGSLIYLQSDTTSLSASLEALKAGLNCSSPVDVS